MPIFIEMDNNTTVEDPCRIPLIKLPIKVEIERYVFPVQFAIGSLGNILILSVLTRKDMRSRTNTLLSCLALAVSAASRQQFNLAIFALATVRICTQCK